MGTEKIPIKSLELKDKNYPALLKETPFPPSPLHYIGNFAEDAQNPPRPAVAIVGTRRATPYGLRTAKMLGRELSMSGVTVVSGLALGIDAEAHKGALEGKTPTWAVLGSGLNHIYPSSNKNLAEKIIEQGGAIFSEFPPDYPPDKWTFPQRNRIVAGLTQATIVVEAPEKSGALITARFALDYNRDVGAIPGEITTLNSKGTNLLLKMGAAVIRSSEDILELLGLAPAPERTLDNLDGSIQDVLLLLEEPATKDILVQKSGLKPDELNQKLTMLEIFGKIKNIGGLFHKT